MNEWTVNQRANVKMATSKIPYNLPVKRNPSRVSVFSIIFFLSVFFQNLSLPLHFFPSCPGMPETLIWATEKSDIQLKIFSCMYIGHTYSQLKFRLRLVRNLKGFLVMFTTGKISMFRASKNLSNMSANFAVSWTLGPPVSLNALLTDSLSTCRIGSC